LAKIKEVAVNPYGPNHKPMKLQGRDGSRLSVGDWRVIYELQNDRLIMAILELGMRGGIISTHIENITRKGKEFALIPVEALQKLMDDSPTSKLTMRCKIVWRGATMS
jgi:hypothetical protein